MYISRIQLENIRGFGSGDQRVDLDLRRPDGRYAGWTVLAGRNGSGKSTLLKAVALTVAGPLVARGLQQSFSRWIREGQDEASAIVDLLFDESDVLLVRDDTPKGPLIANLVWNFAGSGQEPSIGWPLSFSSKSENILTFDLRKDRLSHGPWSDNPVGWFVAGYGASRRLNNNALDTYRPAEGTLKTARLTNLFREDISLTEGVQWLRELHLRRLEERPGAQSLLDGVFKFLNDNLLPDSTKVEKVDSEGLWVAKHGVSLPVLNMSDGYRTVVALVMDLVRQLHATYGEFEPVQQSGRWCVPYSGVVLIDEVELHLHLSWQRRIGFWMKTHFPNIQFIVTTHSPFVCQAADPRGLIRLPAPEEDRTAEHVSAELYKTVVNGTVDEAALTELFGLEHVHSDESERLRERVSQLEGRVLEGEATAEERTELERLAAQLPDTGSALVDRAVRKFGLDE